MSFPTNVGFSFFLFINFFFGISFVILSESYGGNQKKIKNNNNHFKKWRKKKDTERHWIPNGLAEFYTEGQKVHFRHSSRHEIGREVLRIIVEDLCSFDAVLKTKGSCTQTHQNTTRTEVREGDNATFPVKAKH